ncbi:hypothetical protein F9C07_5538 [Aspergillus flavus]|uniref:Uncharacterized protein n=1 Tax=Aspergillus flavus (strain ATCC 200026 / FGSC A1120 / IAM 13836 / NRRL 3357 / JCM 12722 / SRRC 167) TaxID=332952 RepID=A0A7U2R1Z2_ASPFN|nr:hypothetical protein AFLA70_225g001732 [Aspergillus flavus AF70]QRD91495.1 hypothetical protein F9C07_5538 [Aspergillus flavus]UDD64187.1 hypothetical protein AFCA_011429 [Aspergillus flavus]
MGPKRTVEWTASVGLYPMEVELRQHPYERSGKLGWCRRMGPSICTGIDQAAGKIEYQVETGMEGDEFSSELPGHTEWTAEETGGTPPATCWAA